MNIFLGREARVLSSGEAYACAGLCCLAVAKCEQTLANSGTEAAALTQAARYFLKVFQHTSIYYWDQNFVLHSNIYEMIFVPSE